MDSHKFTVLVRKHFRFLIEEYGFSIGYAENRRDAEETVVLQNDYFKIKLYEDRLIVAIDIGIMDAPDYYITSEQWNQGKGWYSLPDVLSFINQGRNRMNYEYTLPKVSGVDKIIEEQMITLGKLLKTHIEDIIVLFQDSSGKGLLELDDFITKRFKEHMERIQSGKSKGSQKKIESLKGSYDEFYKLPYPEFPEDFPFLGNFHGWDATIAGIASSYIKGVEKEINGPATVKEMLSNYEKENTDEYLLYNPKTAEDKKKFEWIKVYKCKLDQIVKLLKEILEEED